jgi:transcriptional regulator GlxA family with amidase domain
MASTKPRRIVILAFPGVQPLDVVGPAEVFAGADALSGGDAYTVEVVAKDPGPITVRSSGYGIVPKTTTARCRGPIDTLVIAGGFGVAKAEEDAALVRWIRSAARRSRRVTSVCSGAFLLARAGLLEGRTCTTHWASTAELARRHPELTVDPNPIFVRDGNVWTSAGVTSGMDLSLALVEEDLGREIAVQIARWLVLFLQRPGGQAQFSTHLSAQLAERRPLRDLQAWIAENLDEDLRVETLAGRAAMSPRNFARFFRRETGMTPAAYVEELRVERARQLLEEGADPVEVISARCGFGTPETMRRAFSRRVGVAPAAYRGRFRTVNDQVPART